MNRFIAATVNSIVITVAWMLCAPAQADVSSPPQSVEPTSVADFARTPQIGYVELSPDGKRFVAIVNRGKQSLVVTRAIEGGPFQLVMTTDDRLLQFNWVHWINNARIAVSAVRSIWHTETTDQVLVAVNEDGSKLINLHRNLSGTSETGDSERQDVVVDWLPKDGQHILVNYPDTTGDAQIENVDVNTGLRHTVQRARTNSIGWDVDQQHRIRVRIDWNPQSGLYSEWVCDPLGEHWRLLNEHRPADTNAIVPLGFGLDPNILYATGLHEGMRAILSFDLRDEQLQPHVVLADPMRDIAGVLIRDQASHEAVGVLTSGPGGDHAIYWDPSYKALSGGIDRAMPDNFNYVAQLLADRSTYLAYSKGNAHPGIYLIGERKTGRLALLAEEFPQFDPDRLAPKQRLEIKARDGLMLEAWLTVPLGRAPHNLPMVVLVHDGPLEWDDSGFEPRPAFLADRGYAVLQINYRGSAGRGKAFADAGVKRWGLEMQDDLSDGTQALIDRGIADPNRIAIVGEGYGGYAALMGGVKTPSLFKAIVAYKPLTDLVQVVKKWQRLYGESFVHYLAQEQLGTLPADLDRLTATSPALQADHIRAPVLLIHDVEAYSAYDYGYQQVDEMAAALKAAGRNPRFVVIEKRAKELDPSALRTRVLSEIEKFLAEKLGAAPVMAFEKH